jgi:hypothetical protein
VHGDRGFGCRNLEGEMILEFADVHKLAVMNTWFMKEDTKKISYESGGCRTVVDYILTKQRDKSMISDVKVIAKKSCIPQHKTVIENVIKECVKR